VPLLRPLRRTLCTVLTICLVEQNPWTLFCILPLQGYEGQDAGVLRSKIIPARTASAWKVLDVIRLARVALGVLSFPSAFPSEKIPSSISWISVHTTPADEIDRSSENEMGKRNGAGLERKGNMASYSWWKESPLYVWSSVFKFRF
jgi:hypothetical protein